MNRTASIAQIVPDTEAEGPGRRFAIWFQGCPLRCPGCCNPEFLPFHGRTNRLVSEIIEEIVNQKGIEGISLLGGEPFSHAEAAGEIARAVKLHGLSVMVYSGFTLQELQAMNDRHIQELLKNTDVLVDGPYVRELPDSKRRWVGSTNQMIHFLSGRYSPDDPCWTQSNTLEIRVKAGEVSINGFPSTDAKGLWKGWKRKTVKNG